MGRYTDELRRITRAQGGGAPVSDDSGGPADDGASGSRRWGPLVAAAIALVLAVVGWIVIRQMIADSKLQDCVMSGRKNCAPVDTGSATPAVSEASTADVPPAGIAWELTADPSTTLPMAKRGEFVLWIVAHNPSSAVADTERNALSYEVDGVQSMMLAMAFGNGGRARTWSALPPGETLREARGGRTDPTFGESLFPRPGDYHLAIRLRGRVVATLDVRISPT